MAGHLQIGTITRGRVTYADWTNSYERKAIDSANTKINFFNNNPIYQKEFEGLKDFACYRLHGKELRKLSEEYLPKDMRNMGNIAFSFNAFVGKRNGGYVGIEVHYDTLQLKGTVYLVA